MEGNYMGEETKILYLNARQAHVKTGDREFKLKFSIDAVTKLGTPLQKAINESVGYHGGDGFLQKVYDADLHVLPSGQDFKVLSEDESGIESLDIVLGEIEDSALLEIEDDAEPTKKGKSTRLDLKPIN
jgi:hypothetical protein